MYTKNFLTSKTVWGLIILAIFIIAPKLGIGLAAGAVIASQFDIYVEMGALALSLWGRIDASSKLTIWFGGKT